MVKALRDVGHSQPHIYLWLESALTRHREDEALHDCLCDVADHVSSVREGRGPDELFAQALTDAEIAQARLEPIEPVDEDLRRMDELLRIRPSAA